MKASSSIETAKNDVGDVVPELGEATSDLPQESAESSEQVGSESKPDDKLDFVSTKDEENAMTGNEDHPESPMSFTEDSLKGNINDARVDYLKEIMLPATCKLDSNKLTFKQTRRPSLWRENELADIIIDCDGEDLTGSFENENEEECDKRTLRALWDESRNNFGGVLLGSPLGKSLNVQKKKSLRKMWENSRNFLDAFDASIHSSSSEDTKISTMKMQKPKPFRLSDHMTNDYPNKKSMINPTSRKELVIIISIALVGLAGATFVFLFLVEGTEVVTEMLKNN